MARIDVERHVHAEIVGDAVTVPGGISQAHAAAVVVHGDRDGDRASGGIVHVDRQAVTMGELVVANQFEIVRLVVRGTVPGTSVDGLHPTVFHLPEQGTGIGVRDPAVEFAESFLGHKLHAVRFPVCFHQVVSEVLIHDQHRPGLVVEAVGDTLVICLEREVDSIVPDGPVQAGRGLPALLRAQGGPGQMPGIHRRHR